MPGPLSLPRPLWSIVSTPEGMLSKVTCRDVHRSHDPRNAIAPSNERSIRRLASSLEVPLAWVESLVLGEGKAPSLKTFLIFVTSDMSARVWSSNRVGVPWTEASRWAATES